MGENVRNKAGAMQGPQVKAPRKRRAVGKPKKGDYRVCVYAIAKDEAQFVDRWMDSVSEADDVIVLDTGSSDDTIELLKKRGATVISEKVSPWRFDTARNLAMSYIPADADICVSNDLDEVFVKGWRKLLENAWKGGQYTRARYRFAYSYKSDGSVDKMYDMEKIHARQGFKWVHPVHEVLHYSGEKPDSTVFVDGLLLYHYPDKDKPRSQYLPLLELSAAENPNNDRVAFWLGREYMFYAMYEKAIQTLTHYLSMPSAVWDEERSSAMRFIARCYDNMGDGARARNWLYRAIAECPRVREPFTSMARLAYKDNDWALCAYMAEQGLKITERSGSYLLETDCWGSTLYDLAAISYYHLKDYNRAKDYASAALSHNPQSARLAKNLELIKQKVSGSDSANKI